MEICAVKKKRAQQLRPAKRAKGCRYRHHGFGKPIVTFDATKVKAALLRVICIVLAVLMLAAIDGTVEGTGMSWAAFIPFEIIAFLTVRHCYIRADELDGVKGGDE